MGYEIASSRRRDTASTKKKQQAPSYEVHKKTPDQLHRQEDTVFREHPLHESGLVNSIASEGDASLLHGMLSLRGTDGRDMAGSAVPGSHRMGGVWITIVLKPRIPIDPCLHGGQCRIGCCRPCDKERV